LGNTQTKLSDEPLIASINATIRKLENEQRADQARHQEQWHKKIGWIAIALAIMTLLYEFGGHEAIENARMACYVKVARTHLFGVFSLLIPVFIFWPIVRGKIDIRRWHCGASCGRVSSHIFDRRIHSFRRFGCSLLELCNEPQHQEWDHYGFSEIPMERHS
jgi:uncharacterized membrane protein